MIVKLIKFCECMETSDERSGCSKEMGNAQETEFPNKSPSPTQNLTRTRVTAAAMARSGASTMKPMLTPPRSAMF
jgi:hypothetical protein